MACQMDQLDLSGPKTFPAVLNLFETKLKSPKGAGDPFQADGVSLVQ